MSYAKRATPLTELTAEQRRHLLRGGTYFGDGFSDRETFAAAWELHRDELLAEFDQDRRRCYFAPTWIRPFAWWLCDHGEERPVIGKWATPADVERIRKQDDHRHSHFGYLHTSIIGGWPDWEHLQMTERDYLELHELLTPEEEKWLAELDASDSVNEYTPQSFRERGVR